eukprot:241544-Pelagomonas_calceolata.AAC.1
MLPNPSLLLMLHLCMSRRHSVWLALTPGMKAPAPRLVRGLQARLSSCDIHGYFWSRFRVLQSRLHGQRSANQAQPSCVAQVQPSCVAQ